jgi:hypothetical protein
VDNEHHPRVGHTPCPMKQTPLRGEMQTAALSPEYATAAKMTGKCKVEAAQLLPVHQASTPYERHCSGTACPDGGWRHLGHPQYRSTCTFPAQTHPGFSSVWLDPSSTPANHFQSHMPAPVLHNFGYGPTPLFSWESVLPRPHCYGEPPYAWRVKPDYRRFCYSVGKADVPIAALPGGPLWGYPATMSPQLLDGR